MFIKEITLENHLILWNLKLDFTLNSWEVAETVILWWENWAWKSTILDIIFNLLHTWLNNVSTNEKRTIKIILTDEEKQIFISEWMLTDNLLNNEIIFYYDFSIVNNWNFLKVKYSNNPNWTITSSWEFAWNQIISKPKLKSLFSPIYSEVWINYHSQPKNTTTSKTIDELLNSPKKSPINLADEITQLLIDIDVQDAQDFQNYFKENWNVTQEHLSKRMKRFTTAFSYIFETKKFKEIRTINNSKEVIFEENWKECNINQLSSWEKQIVFRWSFLLQNQNSINWNLILIDEPEISLHPDWQLKILDFYKNLFKDISWKQKSQLIVVTHSPFIINNPNRLNDKVITLSKEWWIITVDEKPKYFWFSNIQDFVLESFSLKINDFKSTKPVIVSEWKNYNYLKKAREFFWADLDIEIKEINDLNTSQLKSLFESLERINFSDNKIIIIWDIDYKKEFEKIKDKKTEFIIPMIFDKNENGIVPWWIENMFNKDNFPENFEQEFYKKLNKERNDWAPMYELNKVKFEEFVLNNSSYEMFSKFKPLIEKINSILNSN
jgi:ABC-type cobalamin/Fe3+-siderophores transport system ATPase subunit